MDHIQTFGREFELVICSSGKTILASSYSQQGPARPSPGGLGEGRSRSCPDFNNVSATKVPAMATTPGAVPFRAHQLQLSIREDFSVFSPDVDPPGLLSLSYHQLSSFSPNYPAMRDLGLGERGEEEGGEEEERVAALHCEGEPSIQRISLNCTAIGVMGKCSESFVHVHKVYMFMYVHMYMDIHIHTCMHVTLCEYDDTKFTLHMYIYIIICTRWGKYYMLAYIHEERLGNILI